jgi:hypothetical protein
MIHICTNCYKTFKTIQHLNQHKNRKHKCKSYSEDKLYLSSTQPKTFSESINDNNSSQNGLLNTNHNSSKTLDDKVEISDTNNNISSINSESNQLNFGVENLSLTNLLEFVNTHKKILEEKNKLESTLIVLKKHLDTLITENNELKNKMTLVNDFVSVYKNSSNNINSNKNPFSV